MPSYEEIYAAHADRYDELVRHEDHAKNVEAFLDRVMAGRPRLVVELGCGTGRVTRMLAPRAGQVHAFDGAAHMVDFARRALADAANVTFAVADNGALPEPDGAADLVVAGWTLGHLTGFFPDDWRPRAEGALAEMRRVARPGGRVLVFETLGTCTVEAAPPNARLAELYALFEARGLARTTLATDYAFDSVDEAARVMGFFFGARMAEEVRARGAPVVPEHTGAWLSR